MLLPCTRISDVGVVTTAALIVEDPVARTVPLLESVPPCRTLARKSTTPVAFTWVVPDTCSVLLAASSVCTPLEPPSCMPAIVSPTSSVTV